jgi:NAD(P)-dependent dehydrogenase (short-subunit alcohol dehydrogenase family)
MQQGSGGQDVSGRATNGPAPQPRSWFITGAGSGIGRALALAVLEAGERVAATDLNERALTELGPAAEGQLWTAALDVTRLEQVEGVVARAWSEFGQLDVVVNSAGYGLVGAVEEMTDDQVRHQIDVNLLGAIRVTRAFLPRFRALGGGHIVQISSSGGQRTAPGLSLYHSTKWGLEGFSEGLIGEVAPFGIKITIAEPGGCRTNWRTNAIKTTPIEAYDQTPVGAYRRSDGLALSPGDPHRMARAIIEAVSRQDPPRRLVLGSDSYDYVRTSLLTRLAEVEAQAATAPLTDADDVRRATP